jgi:hypothetical protein
MGIAVLASAFAQGAAAQETFTCAQHGGKKDFGGGDSHCSGAKVPELTGEYGHVAFTMSTPITETNSSTGGGFFNWILKSVQSGVTLEIKSTKLFGSGTTQNSGGNASGTQFTVFENVTVTAPAGKGCQVESIPVTTGEVAQVGVIHSKEIAFSSAGLTNEVKFSPATGSVFAEFAVKGCSISALNHVYTLTGSVKGQTSGATTSFTHANTTAQETLFLFGQKAGIEGTKTYKGPNGNAMTWT